ncbi:unnamed protein product, partial [Ixodes persulcatus]
GRGLIRPSSTSSSSRFDDLRSFVIGLCTFQVTQDSTLARRAQRGEAMNTLNKYHAAARFRSCGRSCLNIQFGLTDRRLPQDWKGLGGLLVMWTATLRTMPQKEELVPG